tara:strand:+ start:410 stop:1003 length:594 start_codon:yes stop_codon:yes gene_type:complete
MFDELDIQSVLLIIIFFLIIIVLYFLYSANVREKLIQQKLDDFEVNCPACPKCPDPPKCPDNEGCPACPRCPDLKCPEKTCQEKNVPSVDDIVNGIFPGRDRGLTAGGQYFPIADYEYSCPTVNGNVSSVPVGSNISDVINVNHNDPTTENDSKIDMELDEEVSQEDTTDDMGSPPIDPQPDEPLPEVNIPDQDEKP